MSERTKTSIKGVFVVAGIMFLAVAISAGARALCDKYGITEAMKNFLHSCTDSDTKIVIMAIIIFAVGYAVGRYDGARS